MLLTIAIILIVLWAFGFLGFHAGPLINVLLIVAVVFVIWHFVRGGRRIP